MDIPICNRALDVIPLDFERHLNIDKFNHTSDGLLTMISIYIEKRCEFPKTKIRRMPFFFIIFWFGENLDAKCHISNTRLPKMAYAKK